jgi:hypothetical protein
MVLNVDVKPFFLQHTHTALEAASPSRMPLWQGEYLKTLDKRKHTRTHQGEYLNTVASKTVKVLVVGNPANTNALIAAECAPNIPRGKRVIDVCTLSLSHAAQNILNGRNLDPHASVLAAYARVHPTGTGRRCVQREGASMKTGSLALSRSLARSLTRCQDECKEVRVAGLCLI